MGKVRLDSRLGVSRKAQREARIREGVLAAFKVLRKKGFIARCNFMCCMTCGYSALSDKIKDETIGVVFFHNQDNTRLKKGHSLMLAFDGHGISQEMAGQIIVEELKQHNLSIIWDGKGSTRIEVK
jgi:hypothetical protein